MVLTSEKCPVVGRLDALWREMPLWESGVKGHTEQHSYRPMKSHSNFNKLRLVCGGEPPNACVQTDAQKNDSARDPVLSRPTADG